MGMEEEEFSLLEKRIKETCIRVDREILNLFKDLPEEQLIYEADLFAELDEEENIITWKLQDYPFINSIRSAILSSLSHHYGWIIDIEYGNPTKRGQQEINMIFRMNEGRMLR